MSKQKLPGKYLARRILIVIVVLVILAGVSMLLGWLVGSIISKTRGSGTQSAGQQSEASASDAEAGPESGTESETDPAVQWLEAESATDPDAWNLLLVNYDNRMDEDYEPPLVQFEDTDFRLHPGVCEPLTELLNAANADNIVLKIASSYRSYAVQQEVYDNKVAALSAEGYNEWDAPVRAGWEVPYPGESEHLTGLCVDVVPRYEECEFDDTFGESAAGQWLAKNCDDYGFIIRYPEGHEYHTEFSYEPWHIRYVGREAAKAIMSDGLCLEEYLNALS